MINIPAAINSWPIWVEGQAYQYPAVSPAASARMSLRPSAISRRSAIESDIATLSGVPHGGAAERAVDQLIVGAHDPVYCGDWNLPLLRACKVRCVALKLGMSPGIAATSGVGSLS
jgi:hypothetical protein